MTDVEFLVLAEGPTEVILISCSLTELLLLILGPREGAQGMPLSLSHGSVRKLCAGLLCPLRALLLGEVRGLCTWEGGSGRSARPGPAVLDGSAHGSGC